MLEKSTIVRFINPGARLLSLVAPAAAAALLERLFLTPRRMPTPARERAWLDGARREEVPFDEDRSLPVRVWGRGDRTVLLVHGWAGRGSQLGVFAAPLLAAGYRVVAHDAPAHGLAPGRRTGLPELATAVERMAEAYGPFEAIVAHSLGTSATTVALARGVEARRVVYVAPPENPGTFLGRTAQALGFAEGIAGRAQARIERRFQVRFADFRGGTLAAELDVPLLVLHDRDDREVPATDGRRLADAWPGAELVLTKGLGHRRILRAPEVVADAVAFVQRPLPTRHGRDGARPGARV